MIFPQIFSLFLWFFSSIWLSKTETIIQFRNVLVLKKFNMAPTVERIEEIGTVELGEGPHWDNETQSLYFVDIFGKAIHKYVPSTKKHTKAVIGKNFSLYY